jgi:hypothetical protein
MLNRSYGIDGDGTHLFIAMLPATHFGQRRSCDKQVSFWLRDLRIRRVIGAWVVRIRRQRAKTPLLLAIRRAVSFAYIAVLLMVDPHGTEISPFAAHRPTEIL